MQPRLHMRQRAIFMCAQCRMHVLRGSPRELGTFMWRNVVSTYSRRVRGNMPLSKIHVHHFAGTYARWVWGDMTHSMREMQRDSPIQAAVKFRVKVTLWHSWVLEQSFLRLGTQLFHSVTIALNDTAVSVGLSRDTPPEAAEIPPLRLRCSFFAELAGLLQRSGYSRQNQMLCNVNPTDCNFRHFFLDNDILGE